MAWCIHRKLQSTARRDYCPDCGYEYYYGDAHAVSPEARISKLINKGLDARENGHNEEYACPKEEEDTGCKCPNMIQSTFTDYCPDCGYSAGYVGH